VRRAVLVVAVLLVFVGCGSPPPDLFVVTRSGPDPAANLTMVVSDGGSVTCNGKQHPLEADLLLKARQLARDLAKQAQLGLELPPGPNANLSYKVRLEAGTVGFSDTSRGNPLAFFQLAAFTKDVSERVCGIVRQ
jgi:hypothetical protein